MRSKSCFIVSCPVTTRRTKVSTGSVQQKENRSHTPARVKIAKQLSSDLPMQYRAPRKMDWSVYDPAVTFDDPLTRFSGLIMYKGMIFTIAVIIKLFFENGDASFQLDRCTLTDDGEKVRTRFKTSGRTRWGSDVVISGVDHFWLKEGVDGEVRIIRHQSTWDQSLSELKQGFGLGN